MKAHRVEFFAIFGLVVLAMAFLSPAIKDGFAFGPFDYDLSLTSLTRGVITGVHSPYNGDAVSQMIAWNALDWQMIHHGQFPLWNQYSALGMPQFLNFESSVLSLPDLVSYLFPLTAAFFVVVLTKLMIAGTGVYVFARVLRLRPLAGFFAGATFMFSGAFASWVTWPLSDVAAWSGWILAFVVLCYRPRGRPIHVLGLAVCVAFSIFGGFPEANVMFGFVVLALFGVVLLAKLVKDHRIELRGVARIVLGGIGGVALGAPLWWPGLQVIADGHRTDEGSYVGLPLRSLPLLFSQGLFGLPTGPLRGLFQLHLWNYYETVSYVGIIAICLVVVAIFTRWHQPVVLGLIGALIISLALTYQPVTFHPLQKLLDNAGELSTIRYERMRIFTAFLLAVLGGFGLDQLIGSWRRFRTRFVFAGASAMSAFVVLLTLAVSLHDHLVGGVETERMQALFWPLVLVAGLLCAGALALFLRAQRYARVLVVGMCTVQVVWLFFAGVGIYSYAHSAYPTTPAVSTLKTLVGDSIVGLDGGNTTNVRLFSRIGFYPNVNLGYGINIFGIHDPVVPKAYFASWPIQAAAPENFGVGLFVPDIDTVSLARRYGIGYVLVAPGIVPPPGMVRVTDLAGELLYRVPGSARFTFVSPADGVVKSVTTHGDGSYNVKVVSTVPSKLILRVTNLPGWQVLVDGKVVSASVYDKVMLSVAVPAGAHQVTVHYWPKRLSEGIWLAFVVVLLFVSYFGFVFIRPRGTKSEQRRTNSSMPAA
jgi:hypothetical protein